MKGFIRSMLRGYGQILFCSHQGAGFLILVATFFVPLQGLCGLAGAVAATVGAVLLRAEEHYLGAGLFACNGALIGQACAFYLKPSPILFLLVGVAGFLSAPLLILLSQRLSKRYDLPTLSVPFVLATWAALLVAYQFEGETLTPILSAELWEGGVPPVIVGMEQWLSGWMPSSFGLFLRTLSAVLFQGSVTGGLLCLLGMVLYSRLSTAFAFLGAGVGLLLLKGFAPTSLDGELVYLGFNTLLVAVALGGFFVVLNRACLLYLAVAVLTTPLITLSLDALLQAWSPSLSLSLPLLAAPFNIVTLMFLAPLRLRPNPEESSPLTLIPVPLFAASRPEEVLVWYARQQEEKVRQKVVQTLPFYGRWYVSQGCHGKRTHFGMGAYAWDFIVVDEQGKSFRGLGLHLQDYYAMGMPIVAPADGVVVEVVDSIEDNIPPQSNPLQVWGNYIIIDHGTGEFSQLSHFRQGGVVVKEGEFVKRGQLLGYCGNSGRSYEPHLHFQLQRQPYAGAESFPAHFQSVIVSRNGEEWLLESAIPAEGELVRNYHTGEGQNIMDCFPIQDGRTWHYEVTDHRAHQTRAEQWTVRTVRTVNGDETGGEIHTQSVRQEAFVSFSRSYGFLHFSHLSALPQPSKLSPLLHSPLPKGGWKGYLLSAWHRIRFDPSSLALYWFALYWRWIPTTYRENFSWIVKVEETGSSSSTFRPLAKLLGWKASGSTNTNTNANIEVKNTYQPKESVSVPAGTFQAVKVRSEFIPQPIEGATSKHVQFPILKETWLVPGIGAVRIVVLWRGDKLLEANLRTFSP